MDDIAEIVAGLSEEQRADITGAGRSLSAAEAGDYVRMGLMQISFEKGGCGAYLTEIGLAVRAHLNGE
jgi:hypothetical protein